MIYFTADLHFGHENVIKYCNRPYYSVEEHDEQLIENFNNFISKSDTVYHLGDFTMKSHLVAKKYIEQLNGNWHFLPGSHDYWIERAENVIIEPPIKHVRYKGQDFILCHYAMRRWYKAHYGSYHLYGHSHGKLQGIGKSMDVGVDACNYKPISAEEVVQQLQGKERSKEDI